MKFHFVEDGDHRRGRWNKWTEIDGRRYLVLAQQVVGSDNWILKAKDAETDEVLTSQSPGLRDNKAVMKELVQRLHEKARAS